VTRHFFTACVPTAFVTVSMLSFVMSCWLLCQESKLPCGIMVKMLKLLKPYRFCPDSWRQNAWHDSTLPFQIYYCVTLLCNALGKTALCVRYYILHSTSLLLTQLDTFNLRLTALMSTMSTSNLCCTPDSTLLLCRRCKHNTWQQPTKPGSISSASTHRGGQTTAAAAANTATAAAFWREQEGPEG